MRGYQIVPIEHREIEEVAIDLHTDGVKTDIFGARAAIAIAVKAGERIAATGTEFGAENVGGHGGQ